MMSETRPLTQTEREHPGLRLLFIEADGSLFRGFGRNHPCILWDVASRSWVSFETDWPKPWEWGQMLTDREAERCYPGCVEASLPSASERGGDLGLSELRPELFDGHDCGYPWVRDIPTGET